MVGVALNVRLKSGPQPIREVHFFNVNIRNPEDPPAHGRGCIIFVTVFGEPFAASVSTKLPLPNATLYF